MGFAASFLFRKRSRKAEGRHAKALEHLRSQCEAHEKLQAEYGKLLALQSAAEGQTSHFSAALSTAEAAVAALRAQLSERAQECDRIIEKLTFERDQLVSELQVLTMRGMSQSCLRSQDAYPPPASPSHSLLYNTRRRLSPPPWIAKSMSNCEE